MANLPQLKYNKNPESDNRDFREMASQRILGSFGFVGTNTASANDNKFISTYAKENDKTLKALKDIQNVLNSINQNLVKFVGSELKKEIIQQDLLDAKPEDFQTEIKDNKEQIILDNIKHLKIEKLDINELNVKHLKIERLDAPFRNPALDLTDLDNNKEKSKSDKKQKPNKPSTRPNSKKSGSSVLKNLADSLKKMIASLGETLAKSIKNIGNALKKLPETMESLFKNLSKMIEPFVENISKTLRPILARLPTLLEGLSTVLTRISLPLGALAGGFFAGKALNEIPAIGNVTNKMGESIAKGIDSITGNTEVNPAVKNQPRGIRNNNPGNLNFANQPGASLEAGQNARFASFDTPEEGLSALSHQLKLYDKRGINTVSSMIGKFAPPSENNTAAYINNVSKELGVSPTDQIDVNDPKVMAKMMTSIIKIENGKNPYSEEQINTAAASNGSSGSTASAKVAKPETPLMQKAGETLGGSLAGETVAATNTVKGLLKVGGQTGIGFMKGLNDPGLVEKIKPVEAEKMANYGPIKSETAEKVAKPETPLTQKAGQTLGGSLAGETVAATNTVKGVLKSGGELVSGMAKGQNDPQLVNKINSVQAENTTKYGPTKTAELKPAGQNEATQGLMIDNISRNIADIKEKNAQPQPQQPIVVNQGGGAGGSQGKASARKTTSNESPMGIEIGARSNEPTLLKAQYNSVRPL
jgi:hypothetical protein